MITRLLRGVGRWARKPVNHTRWVAVVTPTDRPKSVRNCCLIEFFCGVVCVVTLPFWHFCWCRGFCHRTGSDLLFFVSMPYVYRFLLPLRLGRLLVCRLYKEVYLQIFKCVSFCLHGRCGEWEAWARKPGNHTSWMAVVTQLTYMDTSRVQITTELPLLCSIRFAVGIFIDVKNRIVELVTLAVGKNFVFYDWIFNKI